MCVLSSVGPQRMWFRMFLDRHIAANRQMYASILQFVRAKSAQGQHCGRVITHEDLVFVSPVFGLRDPIPIKRERKSPGLQHHDILNVCPRDRTLQFPSVARQKFQGTPGRYPGSGVQGRPDQGLIRGREDHCATASDPEPRHPTSV